MKISIWNFAHPPCNFWIESVQWGFPPNMGKYICCPVYFLDHAPRSNRYTDSYAKCFKWRVSAHGQSFWGSRRCPKTPQKGGWIGSFKPKRQNLYIAISPELLILPTIDLRTEFRPRKALRGWSAITPKQTQHGWRPPSWKSISRHISAMGGPIWKTDQCRITQRLRWNGRDRNRK